MSSKFSRLFLSAVLMMCCAVSALAQLGTPPNDEIWYTTTDGNKCDPYKSDVFGATIKSNKYENGHGTIKFNGNVTSIGYYAFGVCSTLTSITIPSSVTSIGTSAFYKCTNLTKVNIPSSVTSIADSFGYCSSLTSITIPSSVTSIGTSAFKYCSSLTSITIHSGVTSIGAYAFDHCPMTSITIPSSVTSIGVGAFSECSSLTSITIPSGVTSLGDNTFWRCSSLTSITIPSGVTSIGDYAFGYCSSLTSITIPSGVTNIGKYAFEYNELLSVVLFLGNGNIELGERVFYNTPATIYVADVANFSETWGDRPVRAWRSGEGDGTKNNPYQIATLENLLWFANYVNAGNVTACAILTADITLNTGVLDSNGDLNSGTFMEWTPLGTYEKGYSGEFNGNGHTINGLYVNEKDNDRAGLFGMAVSGAYIHDLGVKDSYFCGKNWVAGICGDFANGRIENCWNGATVISNGDNSCAGGIAGSCWVNASVACCYNIGKISAGSGANIQCGGICGTVAKNDNVTYSVSNCVSLEGKCTNAYTLGEGCPIDKISNVYIKDASAFKSGEVCWILNGNQRSAKWRQHIGTDDFPAWTGDYIVYNDATGYHNETMCEVAENHIHSWMEPKTITLYDGSQITYCRCEECRKYYQSDDRTIELSGEECSRIQPSTGDGKKESPYQIATLENLLWFADYVNSTKDNASACAMLTADITMNTNVLNSSGNLNSNTFDAWNPIGGHNVDYSGEFNGNGHTISGLYFKDTKTNNVGLFGKVTGNAYIHDLGIKDSYFYGHDHVGGICGDFASGRIENCWSGAYVMAHEYDAGGISGSCYVNASIANCYNIGDVSTNVEKGETQDSRFGGICGSVYSSSATYSIDNCYTLINNGGTEEDAAERAKLPHTDCNKIYGLLVDGCPPSKIHDSFVKNAKVFIGGEVCYRLNRGVTDGSQKWFQTLGSDPSPVMDNSHNTVYYGYDGDVLKYSNTPLTITTTKHEQCDATCNARGYLQTCWEDTKSGRIYAEAACLHELNPAAVISYIPSAEDPTDKTNQGDVTGWTQEVNKKYDGVSFGYAAVKVFEDNSDNTDNYGTDEWVSFKVKEANAKNARLKWSLTGDKNKKYNGRYGTYTLTYKVGDNEQEIPLSSTQFETSSEVYVLNLGNLSRNSEIEFHIKGYANKCTTPNEVTWAVTLEYVSEHSPQHVDAMAATCTEKGNYENWYCKKCDKHFANAECTTVMTDWEILALGHKATHNVKKDATCTEDGNIEYWHCSNCNLNYSDQACTNQITGSVVIPATHHAKKQLVPYKAPTADAEGNIEYWHCNDCGKDFGDKGCTKEVTDADIELAKLLNVLHIDFDGTSTPIENEHYMDATEIGFTEKGDIIFTTNKQADNKPTVTYPASMIKEIGFFNGAPTVELKANEDPKNKGDYYTTFYSSLEAYAIPEGVKAYTATQDDGTEILNLSEINGGVIPAGEAVVLKSTGNSYSLAVSDFDDNTGTNVLQGTDVEISAPTGCYVLSGTAQLGMGLYPWTAGKSLSANKAYLQLIKSSPVKAIIFRFDDGGTTGISETTPPDIDNGPAYNLNGIQVNDHYNGIIIRNGKKTLER